MRILHNSIYNRCKFDTTTAKPAITRKNENRRHRIRNRSPTKPNPNRRRPNPRHSHRTPKKHKPRPSSRTTSPTATRRNLQRRNPKTLGRKLFYRTQKPRPSSHRISQTRIPLRPNSSSPRASRFSKRWNFNAHR